MQKFFKSLKQVLVPALSPEVRRDIDRVNLKNLGIMSLSGAFVEAIMLVVYVSTSGAYDESLLDNIVSVALCVLLCLVSRVIAMTMQRRGTAGHRGVACLMALFYIAFSVWGAFASYRRYIMHEQMLTFFTVELLCVCFLVFSPLASVLLMGGAYCGLYLTLYLTDGAATVSIYNYILFMLLSILGMIVRYHQQVSVSRNALELQESNEKLRHAARHDALTGLRNRIALDQDTPGFLGCELIVMICDINGFKRINDTHGHAVGDYVLTRASDRIRTRFPDCAAYRYGGDEFLMILTRERGAPLTEAERRILTAEDPIELTDSRFPASLSIGAVCGAPDDDAALQELIAAADRRMYEMKDRCGAVRS